MSVFHSNVECSPIMDQYVTILQTQKGKVAFSWLVSCQLFFLCGFIHLRHAGFYPYVILKVRC